MKNKKKEHFISQSKKNMQDIFFESDATTLMEFYQDLFGRREGTVKYLNIHGDKKQDPVCRAGEHYLGVDDLAQYQCQKCLTLFSAGAMKKEMRVSQHFGRKAELYIDDIQKLRKLVLKDKPPSREKVTLKRYRYLTGLGYQYIERTFYDPY